MSERRVCFRWLRSPVDGGSHTDRISAGGYTRDTLGPRVRQLLPHSTEIYWFDRSAAAVVMYFE
jgi:hypothetical protein